MPDLIRQHAQVLGRKESFDPADAGSLDTGSSPVWRRRGLPSPACCSSCCPCLSVEYPTRCPLCPLTCNF